MRIKACIIGHFGGDKIFLDGQTIKTKIVTDELKKQLGYEQVSVLDTYGGRKMLIKCFFKTFVALMNSDNVIMLPAHNGVKFFAPVLFFWNMFFHRKLHYSVIGGWLPEMTCQKRIFRFFLKRFDYIYVETNTMKNALEKQNFKNVIVIPNCKKLTPLNKEKLVYHKNEPYRLCTFSRVNRLKGIEDAANVIVEINSYYGRIIYELDIYGRIDLGEEEWFKTFLKRTPDYIKYCGQKSPNNSVDVIKNYFALLFPTKYYTEGVPGTIIDAYSAGVPVISSRWQSFSEIIEENVTGIGYEFDNYMDLKRQMLNIKNDIDMFNSLKINCIEKSHQYMPDVALKCLIDNI